MSQINAGAILATSGR